MPRPSLGLSEATRLRLTEAEQKAFIQFAKQAGESRARLLRKAVRDMVGLGPDMLRADLESFREAVYQVAAIGRNLNQVARVLNAEIASGEAPDLKPLPGAIADSRAAVVALQEQLTRIIEQSRVGRYEKRKA